MKLKLISPLYVPIVITPKRIGVFEALPFLHGHPLVQVPLGIRGQYHKPIPITTTVIAGRSNPGTPGGVDPIIDGKSGLLYPEKPFPI
jgi:hypothetical protein